MVTNGADGADKQPAPLIPHVLHVVDRDAFARFGCMFRQLGLALSAAEVRVSLLTDEPAAVAELEATPVEARHFPALSGWSAWRLLSFLRRQFSPPPDVVHTWSTAALGQLSDWTLAADRPLLVHVSTRRDLERFKRRGIRSNERLLAACRHYAERLRERWPASAESITVSRPALLVPEQAPELNVRDRTLGLLWTGVLDDRSGLEVLIEAVARLRSMNCDLQLVLIGQGPATRDIWQEVRRRRVQDCVSLIAKSGLWDQALAGADVYVVPACQHDLALGPLMAMGLGKVVVSSRDQPAEWFIEDQTTLQFTPGSAVELAYHITRTAAGHPNVRAVTRAAAQYVRENHAVTVLAGELATLYRETLASKPAASRAAPGAQQ